MVMVQLISKTLVSLHIIGQGKMNDKMSNLKFAILIGLLLMPGRIFAARLYFEPATLNMEVGKTAKIDIMLDPEGEPVNAVELEARFTSGLINFASALTDNSIISLWIESPKVAGTSIKMAGIVPGGFEGLLGPGSDKASAGKIVSLLFLPSQQGIGKIDLANAKVIKNDGKSTLAKVALGDLNYTVIASTTSTSTKSYDYDDNIPPDDFVPQVITSKYIHGGKKVLIFNTTDSGSGVDHYEVKEGDRDYTRAESPYLLVNQELDDTIYVRAIDYAGNARTVTLNEQDVGSGPSLSDYSSLAIVAVIILVLIILLWIFSKKGKSQGP
jgi:hypothetical protein